MEHKTEFYLCLFSGIFGAHKFYKKEFGKGFLYLFTAGLFIFGWITDIIYLYKITYLGKEDTREQRRITKQRALEEERERIIQMDKQGVAYCPRCKSTSIQYVERRKQLSLGRAAVGTVLINPIAGAVGAVTSKKYKGKVKCLKCGHEWKA